MNILLNSEEVEVIIEAFYTETLEAIQDIENDERRGRNTVTREAYKKRAELCRERFINLAKEQDE